MRDRAVIVTFLLTGAMLREIVHLDKGDMTSSIDDSVTSQRRRSEHSLVSRFFQDGNKVVFKTAEAQEPGESKSHSESYEPQESCDKGSVSAFSNQELMKRVNGLKLLGG